MNRSPFPRPMSTRAFAFGGFMLLVGGATGAFGAAGGSGTVNTVAGISVGDRAVSIAADRAESERTSVVRGYATFATGTSGDQSMGVAEREAVGEDGSGSDVVSPGDFDLADLSATVVDASALVDVTAHHVRSVADGHLASVRAFGGLVDFDGLRTTSATEVGDTQASASRSVSIDGVRIVDLGVLLGALGVDPYALTCGGLEAAGEALNVDASGACAALDSARAAIDDAASTLTDAVPALEQITDGLSEANVQADRDAAADPSATLLQLLTIAADYPSITLTNVLNLATTRTELLNGLDEILAAFDDLGVVNAADLGSHCGSASDGLAEVTGALSAIDPAGIGSPLSDAQAEIDDACAAVVGALDAVLDTPLVTLQGVDIVMDSTAQPNEPASSAAVEIASLSVGLNEEVTVSADNAEAVTDAAVAVMSEAINGLIGPLGETVVPPTLDLLTIANHNGLGDDGYWFADSSLTLLQLGIPSQTLVVPTGSDRALDLIDDSTEAQATDASTTTPDVMVAAGVFDTSSRFNPLARWAGQPDDGSGDDGSGDDGDGGGGSGGSASSGGTIGRKVIGDNNLPRTGSSDRAQVVLGLLLVGGAAGVKRGALRP